VTAATLSERARHELLVAAEWIAEDNPVAAEGLIVAVEAAAERIGEYPQIGRRRPELARGPYRFLTLTAYPYLLVYAEDEVPPIIVRIVHGARDLPRVLRDLR
jgi:toxin ParE1/3/4